MLLASKIERFGTRVWESQAGDLSPRATLPCSCSLSLPGFQTSGLGFVAESPKYDDKIQLPFLDASLLRAALKSLTQSLIAT